MIALILAALLLALLACWLWYGLEDPETKMTVRWLRDLIQHEMDQRPVSRTDWRAYRRRRPERGRR